MIDFIILTGPTGVGKTKISVEIAKNYKGEIISADSMQIYKKLDIGTAKIRKEEMEGITHHMLDLVEPGQYFSVKDFRRIAKEKIEEIKKKNKLPIIVGGTGLYINSLIKPFDFGMTGPVREFRLEMEEIYKKDGLAEIFKLLEKKDPKKAKTIDKNNKNRLIRALEIATYKKEIEKVEIPDYKYIFLGLNRPRPQLYERINKRVDLMMEEGLLNEVINLKNEGLEENIRQVKAIGYVEMLDYLAGEISIEEAIEKIKQHSRNYAKRQITWFKRENIRWFFSEEPQCLKDILEYIGEKIERI
ncbi:tRNA (adenosine(37)-N6)-dimethylallyltransferase MiaA [Peptoniphilus sp. GNH]|nr:tRNA (adenosine(37)-N6)-dimethylallyltransferase MiaA [Peptoniphilus sp. GNH]